MYNAEWNLLRLWHQLNHVRHLPHQSNVAYNSYYIRIVTCSRDKLNQLNAHALKVTEPFVFNDYVQPIALPKQMQVTPVGSLAVVSGWGATVVRIWFDFFFLLLLRLRLSSSSLTLVEIKYWFSFLSFFMRLSSMPPLICIFSPSIGERSTIARIEGGRSTNHFRCWMWGRLLHRLLRYGPFYDLRRCSWRWNRCLPGWQWRPISL